MLLLSFLLCWKYVIKLVTHTMKINFLDREDDFSFYTSIYCSTNEIFYDWYEIFTSKWIQCNHINEGYQRYIMKSFFFRNLKHVSENISANKQTRSLFLTRKEKMMLNTEHISWVKYFSFSRVFQLLNLGVFVRNSIETFCLSSSIKHR